MKLIIGLGNPGEKYENTRHNAGFLAVDQLAQDFDFEPFKEGAKYNALLSEGQIAGQKVLLVKPLTFMNLSGRAVQKLIDFFKVDLEDILVIYDDVAIDSGALRFRPDGSAGGHNGLKSLIQELGTQEFNRLRVGIKPLNAFAGDLADYVLGQFSDEELDLLEDALEKIPKAVELWLRRGIEEVMNEVN